MNETNIKHGYNLMFREASGAILPVCKLWSILPRLIIDERVWQSLRIYNTYFEASL